MLLAFFDWLTPKIEQKSKEAFQNWWLVLSDLNPGNTGQYVSCLIAKRFSETFAKSRTHFIWSTFVLSQSVFILLFLWTAIGWGLFPNFELQPFWLNLQDIFLSIKHCIIPLLLVNTWLDMMSLGITYSILKKASISKNLQEYLKLIAIDMAFAVFFIVISGLLFTNFFMSGGIVGGYVVILALFSILCPVVFLTIGIALLIEFNFPKSGERDAKQSLQNIAVPLIILCIGVVFFFSAKYNISVIPSMLNLNLNNIAVIFILSAALTAAFPTIINLICLVCIIVLKVLASPVHSFVSLLISRLAETRKKTIYLIVFVLAGIKDVLMVILIKQ